MGAPIVCLKDNLPFHAPQADMIMGSDHLGTSLQAGDAGFEPPDFAFWHEFNAGA